MKLEAKARLAAALDPVKIKADYITILKQYDQLLKRQLFNMQDPGARGTVQQISSQLDKLCDKMEALGAQYTKATGKDYRKAFKTSKADPFGVWMIGEHA